GIASIFVSAVPLADVRRSHDPWASSLALRKSLSSDKRVARARRGQRGGPHVARLRQRTDRGSHEARGCLGLTTWGASKGPPNPPTLGNAPAPPGRSSSLRWLRISSGSTSTFSF